MVLLALFALIGMAAAENVKDDGMLYKEEKDLTFNVDQKVSGTGFFSTYKYSLMPNALGTEGFLFNGVEAKNHAHGSGTIETESHISGKSSYTNESDLYKEHESDDVLNSEVYEETATCVIKMKKENRMTYSPMAMAIGARYYTSHPITFNSLLKEGTAIKNRDSFNSMDHIVEGAHGLDEVIEVQSYSDSNPIEVTSMKVEEDLIDGKAHFGALQLAGIPKDEETAEETQTLGLAAKAWQKPLTVVDEDFAGTYHIRKNMTLTTSSSETEKWDAWLPCCSGGYLDMPTYYQRGSMGFGSNLKRIFDCSCPKSPSRA